MMVAMILVAVLLVVQFAFAYHARQVLAGGVQDGATSAATRNASLGDGQATAAELINNSAGNLISGVSVGGSETADVITITATAEVVSVLPGFSMTVSAEGSASRERFRSQGGG